MEFKSDVLKTTIVLKEDKVCIEIKGIFDKLGGLKNVEFKYEKHEAIDLVRSRRKGAIESKIQEDFIFSYRPIN